MSLFTLMTIVMFTLKLLGLFHHGWLVVFTPEIVVVTLAFIVTLAEYTLKALNS